MPIKQADLPQADILLLDIRMTLMDGTQVYTQIREWHSTLCRDFSHRPR
ncbi:hypothetical protein [Yersinia pseudotuberculosis]|nr:hypothetical protein [Yersinia pseudotuberculosis]